MRVCQFRHTCKKHIYHIILFSVCQSKKNDAGEKSPASLCSYRKFQDTCQDSFSSIVVVSGLSADSGEDVSSAEDSSEDDGSIETSVDSPADDSPADSSEDSLDEILVSEDSAEDSPEEEMLGSEDTSEDSLDDGLLGSEDELGGTLLGGTLLGGSRLGSEETIDDSREETRLETSLEAMLETLLETALDRLEEELWSSLQVCGRWPFSYHPVAVFLHVVPAKSPVSLQYVAEMISSSRTKE